jgi:chromosomal replication initiator protein
MLSAWKGPITVLHRRAMPEIAQEVAESYDVTVRDITGPSRRKAISRARQAFMYEAYQQPHLSTPMIGAFLGGRDHTTIVHGVKQHRERLRVYAQAVADLEVVE